MTANKNRTAARSTNEPGEANQLTGYGRTPMAHPTAGLRVWVHHAHLSATALGVSVDRAGPEAFTGTIARLNDDNTVNIGYLDHLGGARAVQCVAVLTDAPPAEASPDRLFVTIAL